MGRRSRRGPADALLGGAALSLLLLDTTFLVDAERSGGDLDEAIADEDDVAIAAVTVAELLLGVAIAQGKRRSARQSFVDLVREAIPVLPYDTRVAHAHAHLLAAVRRSGRPRGAHDLITAATAVSSGRTVVTADFTGFQGLPDVRLAQH